MTSGSRTSSSLVFAAGFLARPIGGILFGRIGDRRGRRAALIATVTTMGISTGLVGILPTYETIGLAAPVLLILLRLAQGLSAGGEMLGAVAYVLESAPQSRRAFLASLTPLGSVFGSAFGGLLAAVLAGVLGKAAMGENGWRIPFLLAVPLAGVALWMRARLEESADFVALVEAKEIVTTPVREVLTNYLRPFLLLSVLAIAGNGVAGMNGWFSTFLIGDRNLPDSMVLGALGAGALLAAPFIPYVGTLTDRLGRRRMVRLVLMAFVLSIIPILLLLTKGTTFLPLFLGLWCFLTLAACMMPPTFSLIAESFPAQVRYTGANLAQNVGTLLGAGLAPVICAQLAFIVGSGLGAAIWVLIIVSMGLLALTRVAETGHKPLQ